MLSVCAVHERLNCQAILGDWKWLEHSKPVLSESLKHPSGVLGPARAARESVPSANGQDAQSQELAGPSSTEGICLQYCMASLMTGMLSSACLVHRPISDGFRVVGAMHVLHTTFFD